MMHTELQKEIPEMHMLIFFMALILPNLALIGAWLPNDIFSVYNKYPNLVQRVSILQPEHWRDSFLFSTDQKYDKEKVRDLANFIQIDHSQQDIEQLLTIN